LPAENKEAPQDLEKKLITKFLRHKIDNYNDPNEIYQVVQWIWDHFGNQESIARDIFKENNLSDSINRRSNAFGKKLSHERVSKLILYVSPSDEIDASQLGSLVFSCIKNALQSKDSKALLESMQYFQENNPKEINKSLVYYCKLYQKEAFSLFALVLLDANSKICIEFFKQSQSILVGEEKEEQKEAISFESVFQQKYCSKIDCREKTLIEHMKSELIAVFSQSEKPGSTNTEALLDEKGLVPDSVKVSLLQMILLDNELGLGIKLTGIERLKDYFQQAFMGEYQEALVVDRLIKEKQFLSLFYGLKEQQKNLIIALFEAERDENKTIELWNQLLKDDCFYENKFFFKTEKLKEFVLIVLDSGCKKAQQVIANQLNDKNSELVKRIGSIWLLHRLLDRDIVFENEEKIASELNEKEINAKDEETGDTLLHKAARCNRFSLAEGLIRPRHAFQKANPDLKNKAGDLPLHCFLKVQEEKQAVDQQPGEKPEEKEKLYKDILDLLLAHTIKPGARNKGEETPLHLAAHSGDLSYLERLVRHHHARKHVNHKNKNGETALHILASNKAVTVESLVLLIKSGAELFAQDKHKQTVFHRLSDNKSYQVIRSFLDWVCEGAGKLYINQFDIKKIKMWINQEDKEGKTVLYLLVEGFQKKELRDDDSAKDCASTIAALIEKGAVHTDGLSSKNGVTLESLYEDKERASLQLLVEKIERDNKAKPSAPLLEENGSPEGEHKSEDVFIKPVQRDKYLFLFQCKVSMLLQKSTEDKIVNKDKGGSVLSPNKQKKLFTVWNGVWLCNSTEQAIQFLEANKALYTSQGVGLFKDNSLGSAIDLLCRQYQQQTVGAFKGIVFQEVETADTATNEGEEGCSASTTTDEDNDTTSCYLMIGFAKSGASG